MQTGYTKWRKYVKQLSTKLYVYIIINIIYLMNKRMI